LRKTVPARARERVERKSFSGSLAFSGEAATASLPVFLREAAMYLKKNFEFFALKTFVKICVFSRFLLFFGGNVL